MPPWASRPPCPAERREATTSVSTSRSPRRKAYGRPKRWRSAPRTRRSPTSRPPYQGPTRAVVGLHLSHHVRSFDPPNCIDGQLFSFDRYPPEVSQGLLDANRIERVVGTTLGEMTEELHHLGGPDAPGQQHRPLTMTARHQLLHAIQPTRKGLPRGRLTVNLSLRCGELCTRALGS